MASRSLEMPASQDPTDREEDEIATTSKEVRSEMNPLTIDRILGSIETLTTTMANQSQKVDQRQADAFRRQDEKERQRQEKTERMIAEVIAVSRESEQRTMDVLRTVLDRQSDLEAEMYSVDDEETAYDNPDRVDRSNQSDRPVDFRPKSGFPLDHHPPSSNPQDDFRPPTCPPILRRSERLRRLKDRNTSQPDREGHDETFSDLEVADITYSHPGAFRGQRGQAWTEHPGSPGLAPGPEEGSSKWVLPRGSQFHVAGDEVHLDDEGEGSRGHYDSRGGPSNPIGRRSQPNLWFVQAAKDVWGYGTAWKPTPRGSQRRRRTPTSKRVHIWLQRMGSS